jgi:alpha-galactosidase
MKKRKEHTWLIIRNTLLMFCISTSVISMAQNAGDKKILKTNNLDATISFIKSGNRPAVVFSSGTTVYSEALDDGQLIGLYWSASGYVQRENVMNNMPEYYNWKNYPKNSFELDIDGQSLETGWEWIGSSKREGPRPNTIEAVVELKHKYRPVSLKIITRLDGSPIIVRYLEITNTGKTPSSLSNVCSITSMLWDYNSRNIEPKEKRKYTLGYFGGLQWGQEGYFNWDTLSEETFRIERNLSSHQFASPYFIIRNENNGEMFFIGLAWSDRYFAEFRNYRNEDKLSFRAGPVAYGALRIIAPGETIKSPETHLGPVHTTLDNAVAQWYDHMHNSVIPPRPKGKEMYTIAGRVVENPGDWILREIDIAKEMGVEAFMVDAGWYGDQFAEWPKNRGDWNEGNWLPGGIGGIRDYAHNKKMLFGLWHESEALMKTSNTYKAHPEWGNFMNGESVEGEGYNMNNSDAKKYFQDNIIHIIRDFNLDFYKLDYNINNTNKRSVNIQEGPSGKLIENETWRHYEAVYEIYDKVLKDYPNVCLENCASGGGRNDLGMLSRFHYACESDFSAFPNSICAINTMSMFIPPDAICYYHNHLSFAHQMSDNNTHLRVTLFAIPIFVGFGSQEADRTTEYFQTVKRYIELNKTVCRKVMANHPVVFHHTPEAGFNNKTPWCVLEYARRDHTSGYAGIFKLKTETKNNDYIFRPRGIDISKQYKVTMDNDHLIFIISGWDLSQTGIRIHLDAVHSSELVLYEVSQ